MDRATWGEFLGTALLLYVVVGSGMAAETLAEDPGVQLFAHALAVGLGLAAVIAMLQPVSGSQFNPAVTLALWRTRAIDGADAFRFTLIQIAGAVVGVVAAHLSFQRTAVTLASTPRGGSGLLLSEAISTFVLVLVILALVRTNRSHLVPFGVGAWVAAAVFATSSTGFANPAVTLARTLTDTYTGIGPASVPAFVVAQSLAGLAAARVALTLYPESVPRTTST